jgi:hypothetical protein
MNITASLNLPQSDQEMLAQIIGCDQNDLEAKLAPHASAALQEYVSMFLGKSVFSRGADMREYRLLLLMETAFDGQVPSEQDVCKLFQLTASASRSLTRAVMSKYQYRLKRVIDATLTQLISSACINGTQPDPVSITIFINSPSLVDQMNRELGEIDASLPPVKKKAETQSTYELQESSYSSLCSRFNVFNRAPQV